MGKVDPSLARSISQVKGLTGSLTDGLKSTNSLAGTVAKTLGVVGKTGLALGATLTGSVLVGVKQVTNEAAKLEAQMAPVMRYLDGLRMFPARHPMRWHRMERHSPRTMPT